MKTGSLTLELGMTLKPLHERAGLSIHHPDCYERARDVGVRYTIDDVGEITFLEEDLRKIPGFTTLWGITRMEMLEGMRNTIRDGEDFRSRGRKNPWEHPNYGKVPAN